MTFPAKRFGRFSVMNAARLLLVLLVPMLAAAQPPSATPTPTRDLRQYLQDGLFEEEANRNLDKASAAYEALIESFEKDRQFAATAVFRLAEIRVKQNRKDDAIALFQRVITEFGNDPLAKLSRERITALGGKAPAAGEGSVDDEEAREIATLQEMVKNSPDLLNAPTNEGSTPLTRAAAKGWLKAATFLLDHGANPNPKGTTPALVAAAVGGRKAMTELLLARGADPNSKVPNYGTPLMAAVRASHIEVVRVLLDHGALPNEGIPTNETALHIASTKGNVDLARLLLDKGADVNLVSEGTVSPNELTGTPLMAAVRGRHLDVVKLLLDHKADPNIESPEGRNTRALSLAIGSGENNADFAIVELLLKNGADPKGDDVRQAVIQNNVDLVRLLAKRGADLDAKSTEPAGWTPLHFAVGRSLMMTRTLLELGAPPNAADAEGKTPLHWVIGYFNVVVSWNPRPPQPNQPDQPPQPTQPRNVIRSPSQKPSAKGIMDSFETCKLLVEKGADINAQDSDGTSPFHRAMENPNVPLEVAEWLLAHGADAKLKNKQSLTPLTSAPIDRRLWLEERVNFPTWTKDRAIHTLTLFATSVVPEPWRTAQMADFDASPSVTELVRAVQLNFSGKLEFLVYRSNQTGGVEQVEKVTANITANIKDYTPVKADFPKLRWGDVLVLYSSNSQVSNDRVLSVQSIQPEVRKVSVQVGERQRDITLSGDGSDWAPASGSIPKEEFSQFVAKLVAAEPRALLAAVKLQRDVDGKAMEWTVDLRPDEPRAVVKFVRARLADGDRIIVPLLPGDDPGALAIRKSGIYRTAPGRLFGECVFRFSEKDNAPRTLGDLIAESYVSSGMVIPDPDLAHIQIHRLKRDSASEELVEINLMAAVQQASVDMPETEARKLDVPLLPGDIVEIAPRKDSEDKLWIGLSNDVKLFLTKALTRSVTIQIGSQQPTTKELRPSFWAFLGGRRRFDPGASTGPSPFRAKSVITTNDRTFKIRLRSGESIRVFTPEEFYQNPWLVDGDRLEVEQY
jgi:ankyrin repeat protein